MLYDHVTINVTAGVSNEGLRGKGGIHINTESINEKEMCQCRNKNCNHVFHQSELKTVYRDHYGISTPERVCPKCGGTYGLINYPVKEEHLIYKSKNFFKKDNSGKDMRHYNMKDFLPEEEE
jgi:hypothetical protein